MLIRQTVPDRTIRKILIVKPSSLGDIIHSLPVLGALRECFPHAVIDWVVARGFEDLLEGHPMINRLWIINKDAWKSLKNIDKTVREFRLLARGLREQKYDCVIDLQGLMRSGLITRATSSRVRIGFSEAREGSAMFYTHKVDGGREVHAVERNMKVLPVLGCNAKDISFPLPSFRHTGEDMDFDVPYAVLAPGGRRPANRWPAVRYGELACRLPIRSIVIGSRSDIYLADDVVMNSCGNAVSTAGRTDIAGLFRLIGRASFLVSNDSGPIHIAAALGVHVFAIIGPTDPVRTGPFGDNKTIIRSVLPCSPCYKKKCGKRRCLDEMDVATVFEEIKRTLASSNLVEVTTRRGNEAP